MIRNLRRRSAELYETIASNHVMGSAAEMAYYLMLSVFPALILVYSLLGALKLDWATLQADLARFLPGSVLNTVAGFGEYVEENYSSAMTVAAWAVILTSASALVRSVFNIMSDIQGRPRFGGLLRVPVSVAVAIVLILAIYLSVIILFTGSWFLNFLARYFNLGILWLWNWIRFLVLFFLIYAVLLLLYSITAPENGPRIRRSPGALAASLAMVAVTIVFSGVISASTRYALVYGSLASVILMMVWLYTCSATILLGNVLNHTLSLPVRPRLPRVRRRRK